MGSSAGIFNKLQKSSGKLYSLSAKKQFLTDSMQELCNSILNVRMYSWFLEFALFTSSRPLAIPSLSFCVDTDRKFVSWPGLFLESRGRCAYIASGYERPGGHTSGLTTSRLFLLRISHFLWTCLISTHWKPIQYRDECSSLVSNYVLYDKCMQVIVTTSFLYVTFET